MCGIGCGSLTSVRSPGALAASIFCLASAFALGTLLTYDAQDGAERLAEADPGDDVSVRGDLHRFEVPEGWAAIHAVMRDSTYRLDVEGLDALVLVTGMPADLDEATVVVEGDLAYAGAHPEASGQTVFVLLGKDVHEPAVFR